MGFWLTLFLVNWVINILLIEYALAKLKRIIKVDEKRDSQFPAFRRTDVKWFNRPWLYLTCPFSLFKVLLAFVALFICMIICNVLSIGYNPMQQDLARWKYKIVRVTHFCTARIVMFCACTCLWYEEEKPKVCYKKWLGPDWKPDYEGQYVGAIVTNHQSFLDCAIHSMCQLPGSIAKEDTKKIPFVGPIATMSGCLYVTRTNKESREVI